MAAPSGRARPRRRVPRRPRRPPRRGARRPGAAPVPAQRRSCTCSSSTARWSRARPAWCSAPRSTRCSPGPRCCSTCTAAAGRHGYFEWARMVETMANGAVVLTEPSTGAAPLVARRPLRRGDAPNGWPTSSTRCSTTTPAAGEMADAAHGSGHRRAGAGRRASRRCAPTSSARSCPASPPTSRRAHPAHDQVAPRRDARCRRRCASPPFKPYTDLHRRAKRLAMAENDALRALDHAACLLHHGDAAAHRAVRHAGLRRRRARGVASPSPVYNYAGVVTETLASIVASEDIDFEVIVVDDHATDDSRAVVRRFLDEHPDVPMVLLAKDANEGLSEARNTAFAAARAAEGDGGRRRQPPLPDVPAPPGRRARRRPRRRCGLRDPRGLRRRAQRAQRARVGRRAAVPGQLHRRPGDAAPRAPGSASAATAPTRTASTAGRTGTCGCASPARAAGPRSCRRSSAATGCRPARWWP